MKINRAILLAQLKKDEGFSPKAFWDVKQYTYGYGCLAPNANATITEPKAAAYLERRVEQSIREFYLVFAGHEQKFDDIRAEAFINMLFNLGMGVKGHPAKGGLYSFINTLALIFNYDSVDWPSVAKRLSQSKWHRQVGGRAHRIEKEIATGVKV